jgi:hypothetical protein
MDDFLTMCSHKFAAYSLYQRCIPRATTSLFTSPPSGTSFARLTLVAAEVNPRKALHYSMSDDLIMRGHHNYTYFTLRPEPPHYTEPQTGK